MDTAIDLTSEGGEEDPRDDPSYYAEYGGEGGDEGNEDLMVGGVDDIDRALAQTKDELEEVEAALDDLRNRQSTLTTKLASLRRRREGMAGDAAVGLVSSPHYFASEHRLMTTGCVGLSLSLTPGWSM